VLPSSLLSEGDFYLNVTTDIPLTNSVNESITDLRVWFSVARDDGNGDVDGDGVLDTADAFPLDASEAVDTDGDGIGNNADTDDDGDGVIDDLDAFPLDSTRFTDTSGDSIGDNLDMDSIVGTWKLAPIAGALGVGPSLGSIEWWSNSEAEATGARACLFDDTYTFAADGSFSQDMGDSTWLEPWQGSDPEACGTPVAPHDGSHTDATYTFANDVLTINGSGAHVGLAKAVNAGELSAATPPAVPESITYNVTLLAFDGNSMTLSIETGTGVFWQFKLVKDGAEAVASPIVGTWKLSPLAGALGVGPALGSIEWWSNSEAEATGARACLFDDTYTFAADGSFSQDMGDSTWMEPWQGADPENCGTPVAPHDGSHTDATYTYADSVLTINGSGAHIGLAKAVNAGELSAATPPAVPESISYNVTLMAFDGSSMTVSIETGTGVFWQFKFVKVD